MPLSYNAQAMADSEQRPADAQSVRTSGDTTGRITDEGIAELRKRIGVVQGVGRSPFNRDANPKAIRRFVRGYGDDNPLFTEPDYGKRTRWEGMIAPHLYLMTTGVSEVDEVREEIRFRGDPLRRVFAFRAMDEWQMFQPIRPGDTFVRRHYDTDAIVKERSSFSGRRSVVTRYRTDFFNQRGELVAFNTGGFVRSERDASESQGKYRNVERPNYTPEEMAEVDEAYRNEYRRGSDTLYWEDVSEGDELPTVVKGPLTVTDMIAFLMGRGATVGGSKLGWENRQKRPGFYSLNEFGAPDTIQRVHWDDAWAQKVGNPGAYDFGLMRSCYLTHLVTNWMGDDAWLWKHGSEMRRFNYQGDIQWCKGKVSRKYVDSGHHAVELDIWCENQRGEITTPGSATVILPSREAGPVRLPDPGPDAEPPVPLIY